MNKNFVEPTPYLLGNPHGKFPFLEYQEEILGKHFIEISAK